MRPLRPMMRVHLDDAQLRLTDGTFSWCLSDSLCSVSCGSISSLRQVISSNPLLRTEAFKPMKTTNLDDAQLRLTDMDVLKVPFRSPCSVNYGSIIIKASDSICYEPRFLGPMMRVLLDDAQRQLIFANVFTGCLSESLCSVSCGSGIIIKASVSNPNLVTNRGFLANEDNQLG
ncbi:hypothetical protein P168DRAFT_138430 [Aspergillus campestris IBT 28561]|uniref:Uncharacterized protein n=1 Tax=Aspergillus campestris (strain IBT 28561) TaxID=1392248 RepID=A0A2I1D4G3_ASPC2|nr:uncharacterized protein P168DRAFT_138430 [Aspergillus campestris IBT 28561]PKY04755.1 hypothetical protein P168DRAFT_138430 [Aspergillus campestris IBT 28561]